MFVIGSPRLFCPFILFTIIVPFNYGGASGYSASYQCGDGRFLCTETKAEVFLLYKAVRGVLPYVPRFPDHITEVDLSQAMPEIPADHFLANLTNIHSLNIGNKNLLFLTRNVFAGMDKLQRLILSHSEHLTTDCIREVFFIPSLEYVELEYCNFLPFKRDFFQIIVPSNLFQNVESNSIFQNMTSNIKGIDCDHNPWGGVEALDSFCALSSLRNLSCRYCGLQSIYEAKCQLKTLSTLDLSYNFIIRFQTCKAGSDESIFPKLTALYLQHNRLSSVGSMVCLPSLAHLDLSDNMLTVFPSFEFGPSNYPLLKILKLQNQQPDPEQVAEKRQILWNHEAHEYAFSNENLEELDLSNNVMIFGNGGQVSKYAFINCSGLRYLNLNSNNFSFVDDQRFLELFGHLHALVNLSLSGCIFESLTTSTFSNFHNLSVLNLDGNVITELPDKAFDSLHRLKSLHLRRNKIKEIVERTFSHDLRENLTSLTLGFNPFRCSCDLRWFVAWYQTEQWNLFKDTTAVRSYQCDNLNDMPLSNFSLVDQACLLSHETHLLVIEFCSLFIFTLTLVSLLFRYRWHIRLLMYDVFRGRGNLRRQRLQENPFDYDVFVSYASDDLPWVRGHLMPKLEDELGLRLCIHERDFIPGCHIVDNIARCVDSSKKILMVFSVGFVHSQWCQFELAYCLTHVLGYDDAVLVVCVDDVTSLQMTSSMRAVLRTMTYIQWREGDEDAVASFWRRLLQGLHEILSHNEHVI